MRRKKWPKFTIKPFVASSKWLHRKVCLANLLGDSVAQGCALKEDFPISQVTPMVVYLNMPILTGFEAVVHVAGIFLSKDVE